MALGGRTDLSPANQLQRLRVRHEKQADIHKAFLSLGRSLICWRWERADSPFGDERVGEPRKLNRAGATLRTIPTLCFIHQCSHRPPTSYDGV